MLTRLGTLVARRAWIVVALWIATFLGAGAYGADAIDHLSNEGGYYKEADSWKAYQLFQKDFSGSTPDVQVLYSSKDLTVDDPEFRQAVADAVKDIPRDKVLKVVNGLEAPPQANLVSKDRHAVLVNLSIRAGDLPELVEDYRAYSPGLKSENPKIRTDVLGGMAWGDDMLQRVDHDSKRAELVALPIVLILSLLIFGGLVAAAMPPVIGLVAVTVSMATLKLSTRFMDVSSQTLMIVTLLGLGLAIDYCLFIVSRFREELGDGRGREAAVRAMGPTLATAGHTVAVSAVIVSVAMASLFVFPLTTVRSMALGAIPAVLTAMLASLTLLPAILAIVGRRINALRIPGTHRRTENAEYYDTHGAWARVAHHVMRRSWTYVVAVTVVLLALGSPVLGARWGSVDITQMPESSPARVAQAEYEKHFGAQPVLGYTMYVGPKEQVPAYLDAVRKAGAQDVVPAGTKVTDQGETTFVYYFWPGTSQAQESHDMVERLRAIDVPDGSHAYVSGDTAATIDQVGAIRDHIPWMLLVVATSMLLLMGWAFRSLVIPLKAIIVSAISISASFGVITWVFQEGHGDSLLGFTAPGYLEVSGPLVMAAILFGLSMDYEVFLLSRIAEEYRRTGDNTQSVAHGLARTGRIITGAALLLAVVIGGFVTSSVVMLKMIGLGMLVAVLLDATVVRGVLVPATMKLLGRWNWWLPGRPDPGAQARADAAANAAAKPASPSASEPSE